MRKISPASINCLKEAISCAYWYKSDLRSFLEGSLSDTSLLSRLNWDDYKRNIVGALIDYLVRNEGEYQGDLLRLMTETVKISDLSHLLKLEDDTKKAKAAERAIKASPGPSVFARGGRRRAACRRGEARASKRGTATQE